MGILVVNELSIQYIVCVLLLKTSNYYLGMTEHIYISATADLLTGHLLFQFNFFFILSSRIFSCN